MCKKTNSPHLQLLLLLPRYLGLYLFSFVWFFPYSFRCVYKSFLEICIFCTYHRLELLALGVYPRPQPKRKNGILLLKFSKSAMIKVFPKLHSALPVLQVHSGSKLYLKKVTQPIFQLNFNPSFYLEKTIVGRWFKKVPEHPYSDDSIKSTVLMPFRLF